ncbi:MAG TPA: hypothetical protein VI138_00035 [Candidatus Dormibacteraeota bacterium]
MTEEEVSPSPLVGVVLPVPQGAELPAAVRQAFVEVDRKCGVFIFPQLRQLGATPAIEELTTLAQELADRATPDAGPEQASAYRELLARAQAALRVARAAEVAEEAQHQGQRRDQARLSSALTSAKSRLPAARVARLQQRLAEMEKEDGGDPVALVDEAVAEWERLSQVRQTREAERLADRAHLVVRPRQQETARSRKALRDQARVVELARAFSLTEPADREPGDPADQ